MPKLCYKKKLLSKKIDVCHKDSCYKLRGLKDVISELLAGDLYQTAKLKYIKTSLIKTSLVGLLILSAGCLFTPKQKPSYLVIAVDRLGANSLSCPEYLDKGEGGYYRLCSDFIRFTNTYTTSIQSAASIASILTGQYPIEHGVRHSDNFLSAKHKSVVLSLFDKGYKTAFFSGGDPITSYIGLQKGFQSFYDLSLKDGSRRDVSGIFEHFFHWRKDHKGPSFSFLYLPNLRERQNFNKNFVSLGKNLNQVFNFLKKKKKWHNTNLIVVGLQGSLKPTRENIWPVVDLSEDNTKVEMFFKPAGKIRDKDISFQMDQNISLADLGQTLFELAGAEPDKANEVKKFNRSSFKNVFDGEPASRIKRTLLVESGWPDWRYGYSPVYLLVEDQYRVELNKNLKIYNTLLGKSIENYLEEQVPEDRWLSFIKTAAYLDSDGKDQFKDYEFEKLNLGVQLWGRKDYAYPDIKDTIRFLYESSGGSDELMGWMAQLASRHKDCKWLLKLARESKNFKWKISARSCSGTYIRLSPRTNYQCQRIFQKTLKQWPRGCKNDLLYYSWRYLNDKKENINIKENLKALLKHRNLKEKLKSDNWKSYLSSAKIYETSIRPDDFDLYYLQLRKSKQSKIDSLFNTNAKNKTKD